VKWGLGCPVSRPEYGDTPKSVMGIIAVLAALGLVSPGTIGRWGPPVVGAQDEVGVGYAKALAPVQGPVIETLEPMVTSRK